MADRRHPQPGAGRRRLRRRPAAVRRHEHLEGQRRRSSTRCAMPAACSQPRRIDAQLPALLAPQDAGDLPRRGAVVRAHGRRQADTRGVFDRDRRRRRCARPRSTRSRPPSSIRRERQGAPARHDRQPARLVHQSRQRNWGVPLPFFLHKDTRRAASAHAGAARAGRRRRRAGRHRGLVARSTRRGRARRRRARTTTKSQRHPRRLVRLRLDPLRTCCAASHPARRPDDR